MQAFNLDRMLYNKGCYGQVGAGPQVWMVVKLSGEGTQDCIDNHCLNEKKKVVQY